MDETKSSNDIIDRVLGWLCAGLDDAQVARHCREKIDADLSDEQVADLITQARAAISDRVAFDADYHIGRAISRLDALYAMSVAQQDARTALAVQKELTKLLDLQA